MRKLPATGLCIAFVVWLVAAPGQAAFPGENGRIVFSSLRDGNSEIYLMDADGSDQVRVTTNAAADSGASLSADGRRIVFSSNRDGDNEIYVMNADGSGQERLTTNGA